MNDVVDSILNNQNYSPDNVHQVNQCQIRLEVNRINGGKHGLGSVTQFFSRTGDTFDVQESQTLAKLMYYKKKN
jgi:hypothetical protein